MIKFRNKYRIESNRMPLWDYADNGMYFITFVTEQRSCNLGEIINGEMILSDWGNIVNREWLKSFEMRKELFCDEYIIMPNHLHAIIVLEVAGNDNITDGLLHGHASQQLNTLYSNQPSSIQSSETTVNRSQEFSKLENLNGPDETHGRASHQGRAPHNDHSSQNPSPVRPFRKPKSISSFIAGFKAIINSRIDDYIDDNNLIIPKYNRHNHFFQPNYYDRIIRNEEEYFRIKKYIQDNPANWERDKFYLNKSITNISGYLTGVNEPFNVAYVETRFIASPYNIEISRDAIYRVCYNREIPKMQFSRLCITGKFPKR